MKQVLLHEYKQKKLIADNLEKMINNRYIEISDEEYDRINTAIESYSNQVQEIYDKLQDISFTESFTEQQKSQLLYHLEQLEADIRTLKQDTFLVKEAGLHFTDSEGHIAATIDETGMHTIGEARDLSITDY